MMRDIAILITTLVGFLSASIQLANAQVFPNRTITIVVPYNAGGLPDVMARVIGQQLSEHMGQSVVIENRVGGAGIVGVKHFMSRSQPDGHTLFWLDNNAGAINVAVYPDLPYDPVKDFAPIALVAESSIYMVSNISSGIDSLPKLIEVAKERPGVINYASPGTATLHHLGMEQLALMAGIKLVHVPYRGTAQATTDLLRGDVAIMLASLTSVSQHVQQGSLRLLAIGSDTRSSVTPDVPTFEELGLRGYLVRTLSGLAAKAGTPPQIITHLNTEINRSLKAPKVIAALQAIGAQLQNSTPERFNEALETEREMYRKLVRSINFKIN